MIKVEKDKITLSIYVQPNSKKDHVAGVFNEHLKIHINAPAVDNKANTHLRKWLAREFKVAPSKVSIQKGLNNRYKIVEIQQPLCTPNWLIMDNF